MLARSRALFPCSVASGYIFARYPIWLVSDYFFFLAAQRFFAAAAIFAFVAALIGLLCRKGRLRPLRVPPVSRSLALVKRSISEFELFDDGVGHRWDILQGSFSSYMLRNHLCQLHSCMDLGDYARARPNAIRSQFVA